MFHSERSGVKNWLSSGELWVWMNAAAVGISIAAVGGLLALIAIRGLAHFWPADIAEIHYLDDNGQPAMVWGELIESENLSMEQYRSASGDQSSVTGDPESIDRWLVKTGNRRLDPPDFQWIYEHRIDRIEYPENIGVFERMEWGNAYGSLLAVLEHGERIAEGEDARAELDVRLERVQTLRDSIEEIEQGEFNTINYELEQLRLDRRRLELDVDLNAVEREAALAAISAEERLLKSRYETAEQELRTLLEQLSRDSVEIQLSSGAVLSLNLSEVVRAWLPNQMSVGSKFAHYGASVWLFLSEDPREANTEGGIFPAIFGTVLMVLLMSVLVTPLGVIAAVYLREYAKQGAFVRLIRIAVNNLAGVPSIVYGVFGLGFFVYFIGGNLDRLFFEAALPAPTFGTPGLVWASLTLALLTVPVVVVSTEEGLTRIPRSIREGSLALGATKAETLFKVVLPIASPSILTGIILAVARAAGEVAPLMLVGVVKLAPTLPLDGNFPYLHLERKFMHLGFHIYDVGFQSPNVEAARPLVYATALLLVLIIIALNLTAIMLRTRLENRYRGVES